MDELKTVGAQIEKLYRLKNYIDSKIFALEEIDAALKINKFYRKEFEPYPIKIIKTPRLRVVK